MMVKLQKKNEYIEMFVAAGREWLHVHHGSIVSINFLVHGADAKGFPFAEICCVACGRRCALVCTNRL